MNRCHLLRVLCDSSVPQSPPPGLVIRKFPFDIVRLLLLVERDSRAARTFVLACNVIDLGVTIIGRQEDGMVAVGAQRPGPEHCQSRVGPPAAQCTNAGCQVFFQHPSVGLESILQSGPAAVRNHA